MSAHRTKKPRPVATAGSVLGGIYAFAGGLLVIPGLRDVPHLDTSVGVVLLGCTAVSIALGIQIEKRVTPHPDVLSYRDRSGDVTSGPAAEEFGDEPEAPASVPTGEGLDSAGVPRI